MRYWKTNLELVKSLSAHREAVRQLSFAPGDLKYATGSDDSTIRVSTPAVAASSQRCCLLGKQQLPCCDKQLPGPLSSRERCFALTLKRCLV